MMLLLLSCADAPNDSDCSPEYGVTWEGFASGFMTTWCRSCHSGEAIDRREAPVGVDFDTMDAVIAQTERIRARAIDEQTMPVGGGVPQDELTLMAAWLDCPVER